MDISAAGHGDLSGEGDLSVIEKNFDDISPTGANSRHGRNPSFLTKDFSISRHERKKSAMTLDSDPGASIASVENAYHTSGGNPSELLTTGGNSQP